MSAAGGCEGPQPSMSITALKVFTVFTEMLQGQKRPYRQIITFTKKVCNIRIEISEPSPACFLERGKAGYFAYPERQTGTTQEVAKRGRFAYPVSMSTYSLQHLAETAEIVQSLSPKFSKVWSICWLICGNGAVDSFSSVPTVNAQNVTPHSEAFQAVIWHLLVSHPKLKIQQTKWEAVGPNPL